MRPTGTHQNALGLLHLGYTIPSRLLRQSEGIRSIVNDILQVQALVPPGSILKKVPAHADKRYYCHLFPLNDRADRLAGDAQDDPSTPQYSLESCPSLLRHRAYPLRYNPRPG